MSDIFNHENDGGTPLFGAALDNKLQKEAESTNDGFLIKAKRVAHEGVKRWMDEDADVDLEELGFEDLYIVWFSKTLQNWKALVSTDLVRGLYIEVAYNGFAMETYVDIYQKQTNVVISD